MSKVKVKSNKKGGYDIIDVVTGKVVGHSETLGDATKSAAHRNNAPFAKKDSKQ